MTVELRTEDQELLQALVNAGEYTSLEDALHDSIVSFAGPVTEDYKRYVNDAIEAGLADVAAGRVIPAEEFLRELREWAADK